jgi:hypothetical protein
LILMYVYSTSFMKPGFRYQPINAIRITWIQSTLSQGQW